MNNRDFLVGCVCALGSLYLFVLAIILFDTRFMGLLSTLIIPTFCGLIVAFFYAKDKNEEAKTT